MSVLKLSHLFLCLAVGLVVLGIDRGALQAEHLGFEQRAFTKSSALVVSARGEHMFEVEMAVTPAQRLRGLQFRHDLAADQGMLFDFGRDQPVVMWMKNTEIALDILFIDSGGIIRHIHERAVPFSLDHIPSTVPVRGVLEVLAGTAEKLGLQPGDRVVHAIFQQKS